MDIRVLSSYVLSTNSVFYANFLQPWQVRRQKDALLSMLRLEGVAVSKAVPLALPAKWLIVSGSKAIKQGIAVSILIVFTKKKKIQCWHHMKDILPCAFDSNHTSYILTPCRPVFSGFLGPKTGFSHHIDMPWRRWRKSRRRGSQNKWIVAGADGLQHV